jgi:UDP-galactopyranose mutase
MKYDYVIVGAGLFGSVFAYEAHKRGKKILIIDKRNHVAGNIYTDRIEDIDVHMYGAHIFHTSNHNIWEYINQFGEFNQFINSPLAFFKGKLYNLPFNMNTFHQLWGVTKPADAKEIIRNQQIKNYIDKPRNLEEQAINLVGIEIYEKLIKGYTEKQWGRSCLDLPPFIIKRLPVRFTYDNNYFNDVYQGIPKEGYTKLIEKMLNGIEIKLNTDYFDNKDYYDAIANQVLYTGPIDRFYEYEFGALDYRSLRFEHQVLNEENYQGNAVINFTEKDIPFTRVIEHKHFVYGKQSKTVITKEFPDAWALGKDEYYPINDEKNTSIYQIYKYKSERDSKYIFGGRLAEYKYYDMDKVIESALQLVIKELG